jgi:hypothetical protein
MAIKQVRQSPLFATPDPQEELSLRLPTPPKPARLVPAPPPFVPPECPDVDCHCCGGSAWWLLHSIVWRCGRCHPPLLGMQVPWGQTRYKAPLEVAQPKHRKDEAA